MQRLLKTKVNQMSDKKKKRPEIESQNAFLKKATKVRVKAPSKRSLEQLKTDSTLLNALLKYSPDAIYFKDLQSRFIRVSQSVHLEGLKFPEEALGKTDFDFFTKEYAQQTFDDEQTIILTGVPIIGKMEKESYVNGPDRWVSTTIVPVYNETGKIEGIVGISRDVSKRLLAEEALKLESSLLNALLENIPDAVYFKDTQSRYIRVSKGMHLEGLQKLEDAIGKTAFDFYSHEHAQQSFNDDQEIIRTGIPLVDKIDKETFANRPDGWMSTTKVPIFDKDGKVSGIVGISRDITERLKADEALRKAKEDLEIRVNERTAALVKEIKEHLHTEKALRKQESELQESNEQLAHHVEQLDFLNDAAHRLAHFTKVRDLHPAIVEAFARSREGLEVALLEKNAKEVQLLFCTPGMRSAGWAPLCERLAMALGMDSTTESKEGLLVLDLKRDPRSSHLELPGPSEMALLQIPLMVQGRGATILQIYGDRNFFATWYAKQEVVIYTLAAQAAISLSNANNFESLEAKARLEGELTVAQNIQRRFTPADNPSIPGIALKGAYFPAFEVGGDYLDYFKTERGSWVLMVADVSGKGIPAALIMTMLRSTVRAEARYETTAKRLLCSVNDLMIKDLDSKSFITAACLVIEPDGKSMTYARAGHPPLIVRRGKKSSLTITINPRGLALGLVQDETFAQLLEEVKIPLEFGDSFILYTDGLTEAMDSDRHQYGTARLQDMMIRGNEKGPENLIHNILEDVREFTHDQPSHDDLTMLVMEVTH